MKYCLRRNKAKVDLLRPFSHAPTSAAGGNGDRAQAGRGEDEGQHNTRGPVRPRSARDMGAMAEVAT